MISCDTADEGTITATATQTNKDAASTSSLIIRDTSSPYPKSNNRKASTIANSGAGHPILPDSLHKSDQKQCTDFNANVMQNMIKSKMHKNNTFA